MSPENLHRQRLLEESELRYRRLTEAVTDYIFSVRVEQGRVVETIHGANCEGVTGYPAEAFAANPMLWIAMVPPEDRGVVQEQAASILAGKVTSPIEHRILRKDGHVRWVHNTVSPHRDEQGRLIGYDGLLRDITDRKQAELALQRLNEELEHRVQARTAELQRRTDQLARQSGELRAILHTAAESIVTIDRRGIITSINPATQRMFGYAEDELLGQNVKILMPSPYREEHDGYIARYLETGEARIIGSGREVVGRRKDGSTFPADLAVNAVNHLGIFTAIIRDITERRKTEEALRRAHQLSESIINTAQSIVLVLDTSGRIARFNPYVEELTGWRLDEVQGRDWFATFVPEHDQQRIRYLFDRALRRARRRGAVSAIVAKDGHEREIEWYDAPLTDAEGRLIGLLSTGLDVTERRILEREILEIAAEEQRRIGQDLHDSTQQQLTGLGLLAQNVSETLESLASERDFAGLPGRLEALHQRALQVQNGLKQASREVSRLARGLVPVEVDAQGLMSSLTELARGISESRQVACTFSSDGPIEVANNFTATHLYRIAQEAVNNSLKHSRGDRIEISLSRQSGLVTLSVLDNGSGIDKNRLSGTGMGLRLIAYRAELIGARLDVSQAEEGGTIVTCSVRE